MQHPYENLENFTLPSLLNRSVKLYKDEPLSAVVGQTAMSYDEFMQKVQFTIELLRSNNISKGDKVAIISENMPNWGVAYFATTYFGAVIVPILVDFHPSEIHAILKHSEAKAVFVSDKFSEFIQSDKDTCIELTINLNHLDIIKSISDNKHSSQAINQQAELSKPDEDDLCAIIYTSGTTGNSKGVMLTHKNLVTNALSSYSKVQVLPSDVFLSILPLAHVFECTVGLIVPILHGSSIYYVDKAPTPSILLKAFEVIRPTMILTVPLIIEKIYKKSVLQTINNCIIRRNMYKISFLRKLINKLAGKKILASFGGRMRFFAIGGAPLSPFVENFLIESNFPYIVGYGTTETSPLIAACALEDKPRFKSTGTAMAGVKLKIKDKDPKTGEGEICVKSSSIMIGYYKDKDKTNEVMEDGWFLTGDLGYIDKDGFLFISGRSKNVILGSNGENIYPEQIEAIINQNPFVLDSIVIQKDAKLIARIQLDYENDNVKTVEYIDDFLEKMRKDVNSQVSSFSKILKFTQQIDPFIKTPTNKIKRYLYENK